MIGPRLKACLFVIGRLKQSSLPPPLSDTRRLTHTHIFPFVLFLHLYGAVTKMGLGSPVESYSIWMNWFLTQQHQWGQAPSWRVNMPLTPQPYWENGNWSGDLLVKSFLCSFFSVARLVLFAVLVGPTCTVSALCRIRIGAVSQFLGKYLWKAPQTTDR